ncbi:MAG TPA: hypothetical protein VGD69_07590 [Herpetosiphonaceae bacterium]
MHRRYRRARVKQRTRTPGVLISGGVLVVVGDSRCSCITDTPQVRHACWSSGPRGMPLGAPGPLGGPALGNLLHDPGVVQQGVVLLRLPILAHGLRLGGERAGNPWCAAAPTRD